MNVLVDIGNTRIKWAVDHAGTLESGLAINYKQCTFLELLTELWSAIPTPIQLAISSVSSQHIIEQIVLLAEKLWPEIQIKIAKPIADGFGVQNIYLRPEKLGVDRWLGLIALKHYYPGKSCLVDCGTAITVDGLDESGKHLGGLISPGLALMQISLCQETENLAHNQQRYSVGLSDFTEAAIYSGTVYAAVGLIEKAVKELSDCQHFICTGGDAELLSQYLDLDCEITIDPEFILKGLAIYCNGENKE